MSRFTYVKPEQHLPLSTGYPTILALHRENIIRYVELFLFLSFLLMVFFLPLLETWKNVWLGFAIFFWLARMALARDFRIKFYPAGYGHAAFLLAGCLSALFALNLFQGLRGVWDIFRYFVVYLLVVNTFETEKQVRICTTVLLVSITLGSLWGLYGYYFQGDQFLEIHSLGHKNHTATYLAIVLALCGGFMVANSRFGPNQLFTAGVMAILGWSLLLTQSRAAWVTLVIVYLVFIFLRKKRFALIRTTVFLVFLGLLSLSIQPVRVRLLTLFHNPKTNHALQIRSRSWRSTLGLIRDHPVLGVGPRNFDFIDHDKYDLVGWNHAHSLYVNTAAEMGAVGLIALLAWLASCGVTLKRVLKKPLRPQHLGYWFGALGAFLMITVSGIVTTTLHTEGAIVFCLLLGMAVAVADSREFHLQLMKKEAVLTSAVERP